MEEYKKTIDDEIDLKIIDQLHLATVNFSNTSLELKKLLFILIGIAVPVVIKLANEKMDASLFVTIYILILAFWFLDAYTYFYQEKLREKMNILFKKIKMRCDNVKDEALIDKEYTLEIERDNKNRLSRSIFNSSTRVYLVLLILNSIPFFMYIFKCFK